MHSWTLQLMLHERAEANWRLFCKATSRLLKDHHEYNYNRIERLRRYLRGRARRNMPGYDEYGERLDGQWSDGV